MYEVISYQQKSRWEEKLSQLLVKDIFYHQSYASLYQGLGDGEPHLFFYEDDQGRKLCYSFLKRKIKLLPFVDQEDFDGDLYDIITPTYGYGGPIYDIEDKQFIIKFREKFEEYCQRENIISEFIRFHPLLRNHKFMEELMEVAYDRETVFVDLKRSEEDIFNHYHKNHQRNVTKAFKKQIEFRVFRNHVTDKVIDEFYSLYRETMDKLHASPHSYFSTGYLKTLLSEFKNNSMIGAVFLENKMIAAALCMYEGRAIHYHLGCSKQQFLNFGVNTYLLHQISLWGKHIGLQTFHLGGGHIGRDSLFHFKFKFNPDGALNFYIGKKIHDSLKYQLLVGKWEEYYGQEVERNFFPAYRNMPKKSEPVAGGF